MARSWIGTSGWSYDHWRGPFYPSGLKRGDWIGYYARQFATVEINASFYRPPAATTLAGWVAKTPDDFVFAVKAWRAITHFRRLRDCAGLLAGFLDRLAPLGAKLGPLLVQLPPRFHLDLARLDAFLALLPQGRRFAFEFRDPSWHGDAVHERLADHGAAFCPFELGAARGPRVATADFVYVRLHGREPGYRGDYDDAALADWAVWLGDQLGQGRDAYVYFDNTGEGDAALRNARRLAELVAVVRLAH